MFHVHHDFESIGTSHWLCAQRPRRQCARVQIVRGEIYQFRDQIKQITLVWYNEKFR
jgi:hypothetical protein